jgi:hypothetical protein
LLLAIHHARLRPLLLVLSVLIDELINAAHIIKPLFGTILNHWEFFQVVRKLWLLAHFRGREKLLVILVEFAISALSFCVGDFRRAQS